MNYIVGFLGLLALVLLRLFAVSILVDMLWNCVLIDFSSSFRKISLWQSFSAVFIFSLIHTLVNAEFKFESEN